MDLLLDSFEMDLAGQTLKDFSDGLCSKDGEHLVTDLPLNKVFTLDIMSQSKDGKNPSIFVNKQKMGPKTCIKID